MGTFHPLTMDSISFLVLGQANRKARSRTSLLSKKYSTKVK